MKTIEEVAFNRYKSDQSLPSHKRMNPSNYIDWAQLGAKEAQRWISIDEEPIPLQEQILVKAKNGSIYDVVKLPNKELTPWWGNNKFTLIEANVTHWRPIERT